MGPQTQSSLRRVAVEKEKWKSQGDGEKGLEVSRPPEVWYSETPMSDGVAGKTSGSAGRQDGNKPKETKRFSSGAARMRYDRSQGRKKMKEKEN